MTTALPEGVTKSEFGYRVQETEEFTVEVWRYAFNWRLVSFVSGQELTTERGYCFLGTDSLSFQRALLAGLAWENPLEQDPPDFDKRAFPQPMWAPHLQEKMN